MRTRLTALFFALALVSIFGCATPSEKRSELDAAKEGRALLRKRNFDSAFRHLQSAINREPSRAELYSMLAEARFETGQLDEAIKLCNKALSLKPDLWDAKGLLWNLQLFKADWGDDERARVKKEIDELLARVDKEGKLSREFLNFIIGSYYLVHTADSLEGVFDFQKYKTYLARESGEDAQAEDAFWAARRVQPQAKMIEAFEQYVEKYPAAAQWTEAAYSWVLRFHSDAKTANDDKLRHYVEKWVKDMPDFASAYYMGARVYANRGIEPDKSVAYALKAVELFATPEAKLKWLKEKADQEVFNYNHTLATYRNAVAWAYFKSGKLDDAREWLARAREASDDVAEIHFNSGRIAEASGELDGAIAGYARALMLQNHPEAEKAIAAIEQKRFDSREALRKAHYARVSKGAPTLFTDVTVAAGLVDTEGKPLKSGAVAWGDFDNDGFEDLLVDGRHLWRNKGDGTFENVSERAGLGGGGAAGGLWADFNNDGYLDFFAVKHGDKEADTLWKNRGDGTFENVTEKAGITDTVSAVFPEKMSPGQAAGWGDFDRDGLVDLYVANYERGGLPRRRGSTDKLFRNKGDGTFEEVLAKTGMAVPIPRCGRGVSWGDFNNDGWPDLYVQNYRLDPNFLFVNAQGRFRNLAMFYGIEGQLAYPPNSDSACWAHSIGAAWGDYDNDGDLDLICANLAHPRNIEYSDKTALYRNDLTEKRFTNVRIASGIKYEETHSQPAWCDFDNDGWLDLYITSIYEGRYSFLYRNKGDGTFEDVTWLTGTRAENGWGCAWGDFDRDGFVDLVVASGSGIRLYRNNGNANHWLHVKLVGKDCNRAAIGARVTVISADGKQIREVEGGAGTASQNSLQVEFGFGSGASPVTVEIRWPCGKMQTVSNVKPNQKLTVKEE